MRLSDYRACNANDVLVHLTQEEYDGAVRHGELMYRKSHADGRKDAYGLKDLGQAAWYQVMGAIGELVVAKSLKIVWPKSIDTPWAPDLPGYIEVRTIGADHFGVRVRADDYDDRIAVGCVVKPDQLLGPYRVPGWILVKDAKNPDWLIAPNNGRPPFYAVPQDALRPISELTDE